MTIPLVLDDIHKSFGGVPVLRGVHLAVAPGTAVALAGENGAGKSTLMKIAAGLEVADTGRVQINGSSPTPGDPHESVRHGTALVPQELAPVLDLRVYENIFLGREVTRAGLLSRRFMARWAAELLGTFDVRIDPEARMRDLPVGLRQLVEIVKATSRGSTLLMLDEPTSALSPRESAQLFSVVRELTSRGVAVLFTTHRIAEIRTLADRVVVLRDGALVLDSPTAEVDDDGIVTAMIGRELDRLFPELPQAADRVVLSVDRLAVRGASAPVSFEVRAGEIVGLAGLVGAGRTELIETIFGVRRPAGGTVVASSRPLRAGSVPSAVAAGLALVPEDRKHAGLVLSMDVLGNGSLPGLRRVTLAGVVRPRLRRAQVERSMSSVSLRSRGLGQSVETLSGGNQQKVVFGRWLTDPVVVLLLDEPTRGVDVGARSEIYRIIVELAGQGMGVILASSDMPELLGLARRVLVVREGAVVAELTRHELEEADVQARIFRLATGLAS